MFAKVIITTAMAGLATLGANAAPLTNDVAQALETINNVRSVAGNPSLVQNKDIYEPIKLSARQDLNPGPFIGDITFFNPALGACGWTDNDGSMIVALSHIKMGSQSNGNPLCGRTVRIKGPNGQTDVKVTDKCMGCAETDIDVSPAVFEKVVGDKGLGRVGNIEWSLI
ncbi:Allergen Asp f 7-like protein [Colletotrichum shisoi]|uniref:Allergen Asp f 7-like protein n=1 Tax=Colletotrichum shisoi TaxID=2078593 RepID=A0A5Q4BKD4_9PEZI|nr:Allergen Asp f 7-like protein [Colletotrichum shisoi]